MIDREPIALNRDDTVPAQWPALAANDALLATRWPLVAVGALAALAALLLLLLADIAFAFGTLAGGRPPDGFGRDIGGWAAFSLLLAFMLGGYLAVRWAAIRQPDQGIWSGALVFLVSTPVLACLLVGGLMVAAIAVSARGESVPLANAAAQLSDAAWLLLLGALMGLTGAAFGGLLAASRRD